MKALPTLFTALLTALLSSAALAVDSEAPRSDPQFVDIMQTTRASQLLKLQSSGQMASRNEQRLGGDVQHNIYRRYLESFTHKVPDTYIRETFKE